MIKTLLGVLLVGLAACTPVKPIEPQQSPYPPAITCTSKLDHKLDFTYYPSKAQQWHSDKYKVNVYIITTTKGEQISLNSLELENYTCK